MDMIKRYTGIIQKILIRSLVRRGIIWLLPGVIERAGYDRYNYEGAVGIAPPVAYYTQYNEGYIRNQFLFERPITLGFFLVLFWPVFFMILVKKRGRKNAMLRG
jgi:hypothetical protein